MNKGVGQCLTHMSSLTISIDAVVTLCQFSGKNTDSESVELKDHKLPGIIIAW